MKISYKQKFPTWQFLNCDIGFEIDVPEGENPLEKMKELKNLAAEFHKQEFPHLYQDNKMVGDFISPSPAIHAQTDYHISDFPNEKSSKERTIDALIQDINSCKEIKVLESYRLIVKKYPELEDAYNLKLKSLQENV